MNIKITHNWLLDYLETDAAPDEIQNYLSLSGPSIETISKKDDDWIYDIEIISNRIDFASVLGIAQESVAILPMFGKKAKLKFDPLQKYKFSSIKSDDKFKLDIEIRNEQLCSRFTAVIIDNIKIGKSPGYIAQRVASSGIKSINNVVDISNYLMLTLGQPVHTFDYEKIGKGKMIMRESKKGEKIITLDEKEITLPGGDIVIEDGNGELIDLCGIMGGLNSAISGKTRKVVPFIQTYNKEKIRRTAMTTGQRTVAATYFEKGLDEERVEPTCAYGVELFEKYASGKVASKIYDIYTSPNPVKNITANLDSFNKLIGIEIKKEKIIQILSSLGFKVKENGIALIVTVPSYRYYDINIVQDLVEEVARIYGYGNIPSNLQTPVYIEQPQDMENLFVFQSKIKLYLKHLGLNEIINYSMISKKLIEDCGLDLKHHLKLSNTISTEIEYLRTSLLPSLYKNIKDNESRKSPLKLFEIGKVYLPKPNSLPEEVYRLAIAVNTDYFDLKGIFEGLYRELNIEKIKDLKIITKDNVYLEEIDINDLIRNSRPISKYTPISPYAVIKLDKTFESGKNISYKNISEKAWRSKLLKKIEVVSIFKNKFTLRFYYSDITRNITEEEAKTELNQLD